MSDEGILFAEDDSEEESEPEARDTLLVAANVLALLYLAALAAVVVCLAL